jgi:methionyl-tRNA formyltransferase
MRVLFAGTPAVAVPSLDALVHAGFDVVAVLTRPDAPLGRKRVLTPSPVAARAAELDISVIHAAKVDADVTAQIAAAAPDVAAIVAYGGLIPRSALDIPRHGWINLHFSLLPAWRGAAPVQRAIIAGDDVSGAVTFRLEEGLDTGPVFGSAVDSGRAVAVPQQGEVSLAPKLGLDDGRLDWRQPALAIGRRARGVTPEPGAWTSLDGQRVKVEPVLLRPEATVLQPGQLALDGKSVLVGTGSHPVELTRIQPSGKKMMTAADWARGQATLESVVFE